MINVNAKTKEKYKSDSVHKSWTINFPALNLIFTDSAIVSESAELFESVLEGEDIQFVGCNASRFSVTLRIDRNTADSLKGQYMIVMVGMPYETLTDPITVFRGYVDSVEMESNKKNKTVTAYDVLYKLSQVDVADWYKTLEYPVTLKEFRDSLFEEINVTQETTQLPLDAFSIGRLYNPDKVCALDLIKQLCQINCVFGRINRSGNFQYVVPTSGSSESLDYYKSATYQEYQVKPVNKLTVKFDEVEGSTGSGQNEYVIQNNIFMNGHTAETLRSVAEAVYPNVQGFVFTPFEININGLPYMECLDTATMDVLDLENDTWTKNMHFLILSRTMKGTQSLRDECKAEGSEDIHKFVSDLQINMERLEQIVEQIIDDIDNLKFRYYLITNGERIVVNHNDTVKIIDLYFTATKATTTLFQAELLCNVETDAVEDAEENDYTYYDDQIQVVYEVDVTEITDYYPTETWQDGKHILHLFKYFTVSDDSRMTRLRVYIKSYHGTVIINIGNMKASLYGQNLIAEDEWKGVETIDETATVFDLINFSFIDATETLEIENTAPLSEELSDTAPTFSLINLSFINAIEDAHTYLFGEMQRLTEDGTNVTVTDDGDIRITEEDN